MVAVSFFFVLSGFLITYLLMNEIKETNNVSINKFYMRRVLRIWPLYYWLVLVGLIFVPAFLNLINYTYEMPYDTTSAGVLFMFFLSFVVNSVYGSHLLEPLWSIGVEEYFYLIWAPLFKFFKDHVLNIIFGVLIIKTVILIFYHYNPVGNAAYQLTKDVLTTLKFELMAIGGGGAYWIFYDKNRLLNSWLFKPITQFIFLSVLLIHLMFHNYCLENQIVVYQWLFQTPVLGGYTEGVLFLWLILNVSLNPKAFFKLTHPILERLGAISYGIYMYQMLVIFATVLIFKRMMLTMHPFVSTFFFYLLASGGVIGIAALSKKYFEDWFLRLKHKF